MIDSPGYWLRGSNGVFFSYNPTETTIFTSSIVSALVTACGLYLIFAEQDRLLLDIPDVGIITVATIMLWFSAFALDSLWGLLKTIVELLWFKFRKKPRPKYKVINRVPLVVFTWLYLLLALILATLVQQHIYGNKPFWHLFGFGIFASLAHRFLKSAGGRSIPIH